MFVVFFQQLHRQFEGCQDIAAVVVDVVLRDLTVLCDFLLSVFDTEGFARRLKRVALIGQSKRQGTQIEEMPTEDISLP